MKNSRGGLLAAAVTAIAAASAFAAPVQAAVTQTSAGVNEFLFGNSFWSFSVSNVSTSGAGSLAIAVPVSVPSSGSVLSDQTATGGGAARFRAWSGGTGTQIRAAGSTSGSGWNLAGAAVTNAPMTSDGSAFAGNYLFGSNGVAAPASVSNVVYFGKTTTAVKSFEILWGSVEANNNIELNDPSTGGYYRLYGHQVLEAAAKLGLDGGNAGSYYVTLNARGNRVTNQVFGQTAAGSSMEWVPISYSMTEPVEVAIPGPIVPPVEDAAPGPNGPPVGAPAPIVGATPAGSLLALGLLGFIGLRRPRAAAGTDVAA